MKKAAFIYLISFGIFSCNTTPEFPTELKTTDSLLSEAKKADSILKAMDTSRLSEKHTELNDNLSFIQANLKDTISKEDALFLSHYRLIRKPMKIVLTEYNLMSEALDSAVIRLGNLKHDLENNTLKKEYDPRQLVETESKILKPVVVRVTNMVPLAEKQMAAFDSLNPKVVEIRKNVEETGKID